jgi:hypothetical protein
MFHRTSLNVWPPEMAEEAAAPAVSHWNAASTTSFWSNTPQRINRYVNQLRTSHANTVMSAARELRKRLTGL